MISAFANSMKVPELRQRILFTLAMIVIARLGVHIPLPGVDVSVLEAWMQSQQNNGDMNALAAVLTIFSGGGLQQCGIFALGIMPYISASIMTQLLGAVVPQWQKMMREEGGRQKMTKWTRGIAIGIAIVQGWFLVSSLENPQNLQFLSGIERFGPLVMFPGFAFTFSTILTIVAGTMFLMWIGDQITEKGIGNGVSLIIGVNIIHSLPGALAIAWKTLVHPAPNEINPMGAFALVALIAFLIIVIALVIVVTQAQRRIAVQYAKRLTGGANGKMFNAPTQYLPLKLNYSGVMPVIFATAILSLSQMFVRQAFPGSWLDRLCSDWMSHTSYPYYIIAALMIFFFSYFWVATMFQPAQIAEDLKRNGGYIPGVRPGQPTTLFLDQTMQRLTFSGSLFLTLIFFIPSLMTVNNLVSPIVAQFFGGTSLLILVGVLLDAMRQVETTLLQKNYDGFLKKGKIRGRYNHLQGTGEAANSTLVTAMWIAIAVVLIAGAIFAYVYTKY